MGKGIFTGLPKQMLDLIKNKISSYKDEATNVKGVEAIGYDEENGQLLLKVEGADSVVPFSSGIKEIVFNSYGIGYILNPNNITVYSTGDRKAYQDGEYLKISYVSNNGYDFTLQALQDCTVKYIIASPNGTYGESTGTWEEVSMKTGDTIHIGAGKTCIFYVI